MCPDPCPFAETFHCHGGASGLREQAGTCVSDSAENARCAESILDLLSRTTAHRNRLTANTHWFRQAMTDAGFQIRSGEHLIVPIVLGDARLAHRMARDLLAAGIYVVGFSFPVVPRDQARIRVQISAAHEPEDLERAVAAFVEVVRVHGVIARL